MNTMSQLKKRMIHALGYELILLCIGTPLLSLFMQQSLTHTGILWIMMSLAAVIWNMIFNLFFEKFERYQGWNQRTVAIRILHALGFEGGLLVVTVPMIAWMLEMSLGQALFVDMSLVICILGYTFMYQWCYDLITQPDTPCKQLTSKS